VISILVPILIIGAIVAVIAIVMVGVGVLAAILGAAALSNSFI
jgi:hypothetical protein